MKVLSNLLALLFIALAAGQSNLDFDLDSQSGTVGGYSNITYTITNISNSVITDLNITHPDAVVSDFTINPSSLAPGETITAIGKIALSGDRFNGSIPILGATQATVNGTINGTVISELSDGLDLQGNRTEDGFSEYYISTADNYGVIYEDVDLDGFYDQNIDVIIPNVTLNAAGSGGNSFTFSSNEKGWWVAIPPPAGINGEYIVIIDLNSLPASMQNYNLVTPDSSPFMLNYIITPLSEYQHGFTDGNSNYGLLNATAFLDENNNGNRDQGEVNMPYINFEFTADNDPATAVVINNGTGLSITKSDTNPGVQLNDVAVSLSRFSNYFNVATPSYDDIITSAGTTTDLVFAIAEISATNRDAAVHLTSAIPPNPGFDSKVILTIDNLLNGNATGMVQFNNDSRATITAINDYAGTDLILNGSATLNSNGFNLNYSIADFDQKGFIITMSTPVNGVQMGDVFTHTAVLSPISPDNSSANNTKTLEVNVVASFDPNDITEKRGETIFIDTFSNTDFLEYTIRFQNYGTANAQFVRVLSTLDNRLDPTTFEMIATSHDYRYEKDGADLDFFFDNIQLPPETVDEDGSNGFIVFKIKPLPGYSVGDVIAASADIFFDYNPVVITETWTTEFTATASINDVALGKAYPIPLVGNTLYLNKIDTGEARLFSMDGREVWQGTINDGAIDFSEIGAGLYILKIVTGTDQTVIKLSRR